MFTLDGYYTSIGEKQEVHAAATLPNHIASHGHTMTHWPGPFSAYGKTI